MFNKNLSRIKRNIFSKITFPYKENHILSIALFSTISVSIVNSNNARAAFPIETSAPAAATPATDVTANEELTKEVEMAAASSASTVKATKKQSFISKMLSKLGGKSQVTALILVLLVGGLGIHRFYLGYTWQGIVQLLTLGGCGIWSLIDLIRIISGDLQPKNDSYDKTL